MDALIKAGGGDIAAMSEIEREMLAELQAEGAAAFDFKATRIKFPSGGLNAFQTSDGGILQPPINMIFVIVQKTRAFWPDSDTQGTPPLCTSPDGLQGLFNGADTAGVDAATRYPTIHPALRLQDMHNAPPFVCASCPLNQYGTADKGNGKACKELRRALVFVEGWSAPALLTIPPSSLGNWDTYASALRNKGIPYFAAWTQVELTQEKNGAGIKFSKLKLTMIRKVNEAEAVDVLSIRREYGDLVRGLQITGDDYAADGNGAGQTVTPQGEVVTAGSEPF